MVESHRTAIGPRQRVVAWLGKLDEARRLGVKQAADVARKSIQPASEPERIQPPGRQKRFEFAIEEALTRIATRDWTTLSARCLLLLLLRTNIADWSDEELWKAYIQLAEAEAAFRVHKSELSIRPIWHQKEQRILTHIFVCFLACVQWKTLGQLCDKAGLGGEPRQVLLEFFEIRSIDVVLPTRSGPGDTNPVHFQAH